MSRIQEFLLSIPLCTKILLLTNISIHIVIFLSSFPVHLLAMNPVFVLYKGEYYRMVTSAFTHGSLMHIGMNMMSLVALGNSLEKQFGTNRMILLTLWCIALEGFLFILLLWIWSTITFEPRSLNNSAVGYSGVLFCYALIDSFHSHEASRSIFGMFSVPIKAYPFILLVVLQVVMPNISLWGHLSGLIVGVLLISSLGNLLFMPSTEYLRWVEQLAMFRFFTTLSGFVPLNDKDLCHPQLSWSNSSSTGGSSASSLIRSLYATVKAALSWMVWLFQQIWNLISTGLFAIGFPVAAFENRVQSVYTALRNHCCCVGTQPIASTPTEDEENLLARLPQRSADANLLGGVYTRPENSGTSTGSDSAVNSSTGRFTGTSHVLGGSTTGGRGIPGRMAKK